MKDKLKENIESIVVAVALALIIRASVVEAFVVPTGSMAPTIYGRHVETTCGTCGFELAWGMAQEKGRRDRPSSLECPVCNEITGVGFHNYSAGDRLLVNKFVHKIRGLARWQIIVFRCPDPEKRGKNYIKRLVGLPGESVRIRNGDLYINSKIERKPFNVQKNMWVEVGENDFRSDLWKQFWSIGSDTYRVEDGTLWLDGSDLSFFNFQRPITNALFYNASRETTLPDTVGDVRVVLEVEIHAAAALLVGLIKDDSKFRFIIKNGQGKSSIIDGNNDTVWEGSLGLEPGSHVVECWNVDSALYMVVDGRLRAGFEYSPRDPGAYSFSGVALGAVGGPVGFRRVTLFRDVYYCDLGGGVADYGSRSTYKLSRKGFDPSTGKKTVNEYFMLGDNSQSSSDSRVWGDVDESLIRGKAVVRFWPPRRIGIMK